MKQVSILLFTAAVFTSMVGCSGGSKGDFSSPEATFRTVVEAIQAENQDLYRTCFTQVALERGEAI